MLGPLDLFASVVMDFLETLAKQVQNFHKIKLRGKNVNQRSHKRANNMTLILMHMESIMPLISVQILFFVP